MLFFKMHVLIYENEKILSTPMYTNCWLVINMNTTVLNIMNGIHSQARECDSKPSEDASNRMQDLKRNATSPVGRWRHTLQKSHSLKMHDRTLQ